MSDICMLMDAIDHVDDIYLKKYFEMKETRSEKKGLLHIRTIVKWGAAAALLVIIAACAVSVFLRNAGDPGNIPAKPDLNNVVWLEIGNGSAVSGEGEEKYVFGGLNVSESLFNALNENCNGVFCVLVRTNGEEPDAVLKHFASIGIYAEAQNEEVFIFPTKDELLDLKLTNEQETSWLFVLTSESYYTRCSDSGTNPIFSSDFAEWEGIVPQKFGIYLGTTSEAEYGSVDELKAAYEKMYVDIGWDPEAHVSLQCFIADDVSSGVSFDYLKYESLSFVKYPNRAEINIKLYDLGVDEMRALSADERISKIYISLAYNDSVDGSFENGGDSPIDE